MSHRATLGLSLACTVSVVAYAVQRLIDARTEPALGAMVTQTFIPYFWRVGGSLAVGAMAGLLVAAALGEVEAEGVLPWLPRVLGVAVLLAMLAMVAVP